MLGYKVLKLIGSKFKNFQTQKIFVKSTNNQNLSPFWKKLKNQSFKFSLKCISSFASLLKTDLKMIVVAIKIKLNS
jgi:hypothetical protein